MLIVRKAAVILSRCASSQTAVIEAYKSNAEAHMQHTKQQRVAMLLLTRPISLFFFFWREDVFHLFVPSNDKETKQTKKGTNEGKVNKPYKGVK